MVTPKCELRSQPYYHLFARRNSEPISFRFSRVCSFRSRYTDRFALRLRFDEPATNSRVKDPLSDTTKMPILRRERTRRPDTGPIRDVIQATLKRGPGDFLDHGARWQVESWAARFLHSMLFGSRLPASFLVDGKAAINVASTIVPTAQQNSARFEQRFRTLFFRQFVPQSRCRKHKIVVSSGIGS